MMKNLPAILAAAFILVAISVVATAASGIFLMELRSSQERNAVRAALRGDCEDALAWSERAGRVPYDVHSICQMGR